MVSALPGELARLAGVEEHADAYTKRPFEIQELVSSVGELLRQAHVKPDALPESQSLVA